MSKALRVDFQSHWASAAYLDHFLARQSYPYARQGDGRYEIRCSDEYTLKQPPEVFDIDAKLAAMGRCGIDYSVLSCTIPGVDLLPQDEAIELARRENDAVAEVVAQHPEALLGMAMVALPYVDAAIEELERVVQKHRFRCVNVYSNVAGEFLDAPRYRPFFERVEELDLPVFIHPTMPFCTSQMKDVGLVAALGFLFDTTLAGARLVFSGFFDQFPRLKVVIPHLGGALPFLKGRIDYSTINRSGIRLNRDPSEYIRNLYFDVVSNDPQSIEYTYQYVGAGHLLFASDHPFWALNDAVTAMEHTDIADDERQRIFGQNALDLMNVSIGDDGAEPRR